MTYGQLKSLIKGLLTGDNVLPPDEDVVQSLVGAAMLSVATRADSLHLMTLSTTSNVLRVAKGDYLIRMPQTPTLDDELLDIDEELVPIVARMVASYVSATKGGIHVQAANRMILDFNAKTWEMLENMDTCLDPDSDIYACVSTSTEWSL